MIARRVFYSGRVQGVGFRYATKQIAAGFEVTGWVKNLPDGRVELLAVAEEAEELELFLKEIQDSHLGSHIKETQVEKTQPPAGVRGFVIER